MLAVVVAAFLPETATQGDTAEDVLTRAKMYVAGFVTRLSRVVAEERYLQVSATLAARDSVAVVQDLRRRELVSDFLLVQISGEMGWRTFRDIREVDGSRSGSRSRSGHRPAGRVVKSELRVRGSDTVTASFRIHDQLQTDVAFEMRENYVFRGQQMSGTATYTDFRRFQVQTDEKLKNSDGG